MAIKKHTLLLSILLFILVILAASKTAWAQDFITGERISGYDRYETNLAISGLGWQGTSQIAVLATGEDFPDALSAAPLAGKFKAPILLTGPKTLSINLKAELTRLKVNKVYIVGGTGVISSGIQNELTSMGINCTRLSGSDRYGTSAAVAREIGPSSQAIVATGENYPDALSIAPWAASKGVPILLTQYDKLPSDISNYIHDYDISNIYVVGGTGVVGNSVISQLPKSIERIAGSDRFGTNLAVINKFSNDFNFGKLYLATGNDFPDALSGSSLASLAGSPIILTDSGLLAGTKQFVNSNAGKLKEAYFLGGSGVLSDKAIGGVLPPVVTGINIDLPSSVVGVGKTVKASVNVTTIPQDAAKPVVPLTITNPAIAGISPDNTITGITEGNTDVTASIGILNAKKTITIREGKLIVLDPGHGGWSSGAVPTTPDGTKLPQYREAVLNLEVTDKIKTRLENLGYIVVLTREGDTYKTLEERAQIANDLNADLFISIHHDSYSTFSTGTSAYYSDYKPGIDTNDVYVQAVDNGPVYDGNGGKIGNLTDGKKYTYVKESDGDIYILFNGVQGIVSLDDVMVYDSSPSVVSQESKELAKMINDGIASLGLAERGVSDKNLAVTRLTDGVSVLVEVGFISNPYEFQKISQDSFQDKVVDKTVQAIQSYFSTH